MGEFTGPTNDRAVQNYSASQLEIVEEISKRSIAVAVVNKRHRRDMIDASTNALVDADDSRCGSS